MRMEQSRNAERQANDHVESEFHPEWSVSRGPACVLERLPQALAGLLSDLAVPSNVGA